MNYIGSKYSILDFLTEKIYEVSGYALGDNLVFADLFAGTGVVGAKFKENGCSVISNDIQYYSYVINKYLIENCSNVDNSLVEYLNSLDGVSGFVYNNFCYGSGSGRNYFTDNNGRKCDAIRLEVEKLFNENKISEQDYFGLIAGLINSIDKCANTASVYGAFLKHIKKSAQKDFSLEMLHRPNGIQGKVFNEDVNSLITRIQGDVLYLDPPYNQRQYSSNYHVLETIARYDNPILKGKTGLRNSDEQKSKFCSKRTVEKELEFLIANADFKYIFLSYNNEGLLDVEKIKDIMGKYGKYQCFTKTNRRFKADKDVNRKILAKETTEFLHCMSKEF
ncbi:DNA adenine methylase [uncultured Finegoldia sp.]|uniref:DNA adenine methylase n=1 Tax=uncultured Finegoldia sp. TaxID=328009 RepID=UPI0026286686|nr:DNA adenine methylase [uncultured Finegoldia sp.]